MRGPWRSGVQRQRDLRGARGRRHRQRGQRGGTDHAVVGQAVAALEGAQRVDQRAVVAGLGCGGHAGCVGRVGRVGRQVAQGLQAAGQQRGAGPGLARVQPRCAAAPAGGSGGRRQRPLPGGVPVQRAVGRQRVAQRLVLRQGRRRLGHRLGQRVGVAAVQRALQRRRGVVGRAPRGRVVLLQLLRVDAAAGQVAQVAREGGVQRAGQALRRVGIARRAGVQRLLQRGQRVVGRLQTMGRRVGQQGHGPAGRRGGLAAGVDPGGDGGRRQVGRPRRGCGGGQQQHPRQRLHQHQHQRPAPPPRPRPAARPGGPHHARRRARPHCGWKPLALMMRDHTAV